MIFKKRIAELINLEVDEINEILELKKIYKKNNSSKLPNRLPMKSSRRFCLLLILKPELIIKEDSEYFTSDTIDDKLVLAVIDLKDGAIENN